VLSVRFSGIISGVASTEFQDLASMNSRFPLQSEHDLPDHYPAEWIETVLLKDGLQVLIRPICPEDASALQEGFQHLSARSIYLRFLEPYKELPGMLARRLADLDYRTQMALVAEIRDKGRKRLIGVARYAAQNEASVNTAESAIVVVDEYQNRGLGKILMERLRQYALSAGVDTFLATVHHTNSEVLHFIECSGLDYSKRMAEPGLWEYRICLERD